MLLAVAATATASSSSTQLTAFVSGHNGNAARSRASSTVPTVKVQQPQHHGKQHNQKQLLTPLFLIDAVSDFVPMAILAGAVAATIYQQKQNVKDSIGTIEDMATSTTPTPVAKAPAPVVAPVAVAPKAEPAPAPVVAPVAVAPKAALALAPVEVKEAPPPVKKDLVREFGSTIEDRKETEKVVQENKAKAAAKAQAKAPSAVVPGTSIPAVPVDVTSATGKSKTTTGAKKSGSKRRKAWRVVKKVVAPWRKWETIN